MISAGSSENNLWNDLLKKAQAGDVEAKNTLFYRLEVRLHPIAKYRLCGWSREDLEDVVQDTLTTFLEKLNQVHADPDAYALTILRNKIGNVYQRWQRSGKGRKYLDQQYNDDQSGDHKAEMKDPSTGSESFDTQVEVQDLVHHLRAAIKRLPLFCQVFFLALLEGRKVKEVWKQCKRMEPELRRNTFDKRIYDCRRKLTEIVQGQI